MPLSRLTGHSCNRGIQANEIGGYWIPLSRERQFVDGRDKPGHDERKYWQGILDALA
jgi:hypothetical protein